jgi:hypothetical protein
MTTYFEKWFRAKNRAIGPLTATEAERRHAAGSQYVAIDDSGGNRVLVDVAGQWCSLYFLDETGRFREMYDFRRNGDRAFLSKVTLIRYAEDSDAIVQSVVQAFHEDGTTITETRQGEQVQEKESQVDVGRHWVAFPAFGQYTELQRNVALLRPAFR